MEDPREDVKDVVRGLLDRPSLKQQAETVQKYCVPNVKFYYLYFNTIGRDEMTVIYQLAQVLANYQGVIIEEIHYDEKTNVIGLWSQVLIRPWPLNWSGTTPLSI